MKEKTCDNCYYKYDCAYEKQKENDFLNCSKYRRLHPLWLRILRLSCNWIITLSSPVWILLYVFCLIVKEKSLKPVYLKGEIFLWNKW